MAVRAFAMVGEVPPILAGKRLDQVARSVHENFLREGRYKRGDVTMMPYEYLTDQFQESNRQQVAYMVHAIRAAGYDVREAPGKTAALLSFTDKEEVELLAEMEHGRWIVERLRWGWRYGPKREPEKKISPHLVAWSDLPDNSREYDRHSVREWPRFLADAGLEVFRPVAQRATGAARAKKPRGGKKK